MMTLKRILILIAPFFLISCTANESSEQYSNKSSPFIKREMAYEFYKTYKASNIVYRYIQEFFPLDSAKNPLHEAEKKCIYTELYKRTHKRVFDEFIEVTPSELIALNVFWTVNGVGKKVKETGLLEVEDPEVIKVVTTRQEIKDILGYLQLSVLRELDLVVVENKSELEGIATYCLNKPTIS
jgi:hypothetical protein